VTCSALTRVNRVRGPASPLWPCRSVGEHCVQGVRDCACLTTNQVGRGSNPRGRTQLDGAPHPQHAREVEPVRELGLSANECVASAMGFDCSCFRTYRAWLLPLWTNWKSRQVFTLDTLRVRIPSAVLMALWCNGSTPGSQPGRRGSTPRRTTHQQVSGDEPER
jgi:hypothetical protein